MTTFAQIQSRVQQIVIDLPTAVTSQVPTLVNEALRGLQIKHDFHVCKATATFTTTEGTRLLGAIPSDWNKIRGRPYLITDQGRTYELGYTEDRADAMREYATLIGGEANADDMEGEPRLLLRTEPTTTAGASNLEVYPLPDGLSLYANGEYRIHLPYWKFLPALSGSTDTNWFTVNCPEYLTYQAASDAFLLNWDEERAAVWAQRAANQFAEIVRRAKREKVAQLETLPISFSARGRPGFNRGDFRR